MAQMVDQPQEQDDIELSVHLGGQIVHGRPQIIAVVDFQQVAGLVVPCNVGIVGPEGDEFSGTTSQTFESKKAVPGR